MLVQRDCCVSMLHLIQDSLERYIGLSRVVYYRNEHIGQQIFPLVKTLLTPDQHPPLGRSNQAGTTVLLAAPSQPDVLWLCTSEQLYRLAVSEAGVSSFHELHYTPNKTFQYQVLARRTTCAEY